jgi:DNA-binding LytR/AlgR family response regulator
MEAPMHSIRIGVVEDDAASCQTILDYLNRYGKETGEDFVVSVFTDGEQIAEHYQPVYDIVLMDIEMPDMNGITASRKIRERDNNVVIIFITAAPQYAITGYEVQALSYLLKPVPWFAFSQELKRSIETMRSHTNESLLVETGSERLRLKLSDILYIESIRHTIVIHTAGNKLAISGTLKELEERLADRHFFRSNSCYLVNLHHIDAVQGQDCVLTNGERLRISRPRKKAFLTELTEYMGGSLR